MLRFIAVLLVGATLLVGSVVPADNRKTYTIAQGDTPGSVAKRFHITVEELYRFNTCGRTAPSASGRCSKFQGPER